MNVKLFFILFLLFCTGCEKTHMYYKPKYMISSVMTGQAVDKYLLKKPNQLDVIFAVGQISMHKGNDKYEMVDKISRYVRSQIEKGLFDKDSQSTVYLVAKLEEYGFIYNLYPPSKFDKLLINIEQGRYVYIYERIVGNSKVLVITISSIFLFSLLIVIAIKGRCRRDEKRA